MAELTETKVTFSSPCGDILAGILTEPCIQQQSSSTQPFSAHQCAILCHGFASHKDGFHFPAIAHHLASKLGLSSLRFDYAGNMDSSGKFKFGGFMQEVSQMAAAKAFLEQQHHKQVVMVLGHSRGAINATLYSGLHGDIPLVVLVAGRYDLSLNITQRYGADVLLQLQRSGPWQQVTKRDGDRAEIHWQLTAEEMEERLALDVPGACKSIGNHKPRPYVLVVHGGCDPICQESDAAQLAASIAGAEMVVIDGADHWFKGKQQQLLAAVEAHAVKAWQHKGGG